MDTIKNKFYFNRNEQSDKLFIKKNFLLIYARLDDSRKKSFKNYIFNRKQKHKFHMVSPSPWPLLTSLSALVLVLSLVSWMHYFSFSLFNIFLGITCILFSMFVWFRDIIRESVFMGYHTRNVQLNLRFGFLLFIVSEVMFFVGFFWSLLHFSLCPSIFGGNIWPPEGIVNFFISQNINNSFLFDSYSSSLIKIFPEFFSKWNYSTIKFNSLINYYALDDSYFIGDSISIKDIDSFAGKGSSIFRKEHPDELYLALLSNYERECAKEFENLPDATKKLIIEQNFYDDFYGDCIVKKLNEQDLQDFNLDSFASLSNESYNLNFKKKFSNSYADFLHSSPIIKKNLTEFHINLFSPGVLVDPFSIPLLNTVILLSSGVFLTYSHMCLKIQKFFRAIVALIVTVIFGIFFFICQLYEYSHSGFSINDGVYGSTFYMLTGFHGFHVFIGTIFLLVCLIRFFFQHFTPLNHFGFEAAIWYWHFVDVVWILLFFLIYYWPNIFYFNSTATIIFDTNLVCINDSILNYNFENFNNNNNFFFENNAFLNRTALISEVLKKNQNILLDSTTQNSSLAQNSFVLNSSKIKELTL